MLRSRAEYLKNAEQCRRLARTLKTQEQQDALFHMAATWEKLARKSEDADDRPTLVKAMDGS